jgi:anion-transporting  ArsA/GET3 family ATPase
LALSISLEGIKEREPEVAKRLFVVHLDPKTVLDGLVRARIRPSAVAELLVKNRIYRNFVEVVPGLKEFAFLWRLTDLGTVEPGLSSSYDVIVWDAPASGHFLQTLRVARNFEQFFSGPLASQGGQIRDFLERSSPVVIPVCVPEEMSVDETLELEQGIEELGMKAGAAICNLVSPDLARISGEEGQRGTETTPDYHGLGEWGRFARSRIEAEWFQHRRIQEAFSCPVLLVERRPRQSADLAFLGALAEATCNAGLLDLILGRDAQGGRQ